VVERLQLRGWSPGSSTRLWRTGGRRPARPGST